MLVKKYSELSNNRAYSFKEIFPYSTFCTHTNEKKNPNSTNIQAYERAQSTPQIGKFLVTFLKTKFKSLVNIMKDDKERIVASSPKYTGKYTESKG